MNGLFLAVSLFCLLPSICDTLDIPLQSALLIKGEPVGFTTTVHRHKRSETLNRSVTCKEDEYQPKKAKHCCNKCLAGFRVVADCSEEGMTSKCKACEEGFFRKSPSGSKSCSECTECLPQFGQITLKPCTKTDDTVCGCPPGQYKSSSDRKFTCLQCSKCENGSPHHPCTSDRNTMCRCFLGFYLDSTGECSSCNKCNQTDDCENHCPPPLEPLIKTAEADIVPVIIPSVLCVALLAVVTAFIVMNRQKLLSTFRKKSPHPTTDKPDSPLSTPLMETSTTPGKSDLLPGHAVYVVEDSVQIQNKAQNSGLPLPDITLQTMTPCLNSPKVLYKVIECIPLSRWREFIRRLGVSSHVMDTAEQDYKHYKDAQYAMLSFWVQNVGSSGATMDSLFKVLREMNLGGCVERIEECL